MGKIFLSEKTKKILWTFVLEYKTKRERALLKNNLEYEKFREELFKIKKKSIENIDILKQKTIKSLRENGVEVIEVKNDKEAREIIKDLVKDKKKIIKTKTNAFQEIEGDNFLKDKELIETDLGDFICQLMEEKESHPVLPAVHLDPEDISRKIKEKFQKTVEPKPGKIAGAIREILREKIKEAEVGITGANAITSDGRLLILENEGNISLVSRWPETHIIISGFEKIVETIEEGLKIVKASAIFGTGQDFPVYVSIISGPSKTADILNQTIIGAQGPKKVFLILLDNGREKLIQEGFQELLYCINCGACLNFCPVFHQIGRYYGDKYLGSKGVIFSAFSQNLKKAISGNCFACTLCSNCYYQCPVKINLPELMKKLRNFLEKENLQTKENQEMIEKIRQFNNPFGKIEEGEIPKKMYCC